MKLLLNEVRAYLVDQGLADLPDNASATTPCYIDPLQGAPAPGDDGVPANADATITLNTMPSEPNDNLNGWIDYAWAEIEIRTLADPTGRDVHEIYEEIYEALITDPWEPKQMGDITISVCTRQQGLARNYVRNPGNGYCYTSIFRFTVLRSEYEIS